MAFQDEFDEENLVPEWEPGSWRPPVRCPKCHGNQTRFVTMNYEMSVYTCQVCDIEFEVEE